MAHGCKTCGLFFGSFHALYQHEQDAHPTTYDCESCGRTFHTEHALFQHDRDSHPDTYDCDSCGRTFYSEQALSQHDRDVHPATFDCDDCERTFYSEQALFQHDRDVHPATFDCDDCERTFYSESALEQHERDSPAHQPLECCGRCFHTESALYQHHRDSAAHQITFECKRCDRIFSDEKALQQHQRDSPAHQPTASRDSAAHKTTTVNALYQHLRHSVAHIVTPVQFPHQRQSEPAARQSTTEYAPPQHPRNSNAPTITIDLTTPEESLFGEKSLLPATEDDCETKSGGDDPPASPLPFACRPCDRSFSDEDVRRKHEHNFLAHKAILDLEDPEQSLSHDEALFEFQVVHDHEAGDSVSDDFSPASIPTSQRRLHYRPPRLFQRGVCKLQLAKQKTRRLHATSSWHIMVRDGSPSSEDSLQQYKCSSSALETASGYGTSQTPVSAESDSPAGPPKVNSEDSDSSVSTEDVLFPHARDSPAYETALYREEDRLPVSGQNASSSPASPSTCDCKACGRSYFDERTLRQHERDVPAHAPAKPWSSRPDLHEDVLELIKPMLNVDFFAASETDDTHTKEHDTHIMGRFTCTNSTCRTDRWSSKWIALTIRLYSGHRYNAVVWHQRCRRCNTFGQPTLDFSYVERIAYRLKVWFRIPQKPADWSRDDTLPHETDLCEGCKNGHCQAGRLEMM